MNVWTIFRATTIWLLVPALFLESCISSADHNGAISEKPGIHKSSWGDLQGKPVYLFTLTNHKGDQVQISNYGGTVTSWSVLDRIGSRGNIVLGFDSLSGYLAKSPYFGALIGRYGNRIAHGQFRIGKQSYTLAANDGKNHLHGGNKGFDKSVWEASISDDSIPALTLTRLSPDGEEGYPGNLQVTVKYALSDDNELSIEYDAVTDQATPVNLTNHSYFNLSGDITRTILDETLMINADRYTPVDSSLIPTGEIRPVKGTPFDFTRPVNIGSRIAEVPGGGYDHNYVLNKKDSLLPLAAVLSDSASGRRLEVYTTEPGIQFYSGNFLNGLVHSSDGKPITRHSALCLETQHFPDSPNEPGFPSTILLPGQSYHSRTIYKVAIF